MTRRKYPRGYEDSGDPWVLVVLGAMVGVFFGVLLLALIGCAI